MNNKRPFLKTFIVPITSKQVQQILKSYHVLGIIEYNHEKQMLDHDNKLIPTSHVRLDPFMEDSYLEIWTSSKKPSYGKIGNYTFAIDGENMFAALSYPEGDCDLDSLGKDIYDEFFNIITKMHYPYPYRIWNYFPYINQNDRNELERYKAFCYGRAISFSNMYNFEEINKYPSATVIGSISGNFNIYFLTSSFAEYKHIENPRQVSAYKYPPIYGFKSPTFARATYYKRSEDKFNIYISGTASVIGYESVFIGDVENQCITTLDNIEILISKENLSRYGITSELTLKHLDCIKVYIKNKNDFPLIKNICENRLSSDAQIMYVNADMCRNDLLVEIEGII